MKTTILKLAFALAIFFGATQMNAQVTVGSKNVPNKAALLDINENITDTAGGKTAISGGLLFPRVVLVKKAELLPFYTQAWIDANPAEYAVQKKLHKGLMVFNLTKDAQEPAGEGFMPGMYYWDGEKWIRIEKAKEIAIFHIEDCSAVRVNGQYSDGIELSNGNFISITVSVERAGTYSLDAVSTPDNGYFFSIQGEFLTTGTFRITVPGMGTPVNHTDERAGHETNYAGRLVDTFTLLLNNEPNNGEGNPPCTVDIDVKDNSVRPLYEMDCSQTQVFGDYYEEVKLNSSTTWNTGLRPYEHAIRLVLTVSPAAIGAEYEIQTNEVDGFKFSGSGTLTSTSQIVWLKGEGMPFDTRDKQFYITTNSELTSATCVATVFIIIPRKRIMTISGTNGVDNNYGYNWGHIYGTDYSYGQTNRMITDKDNFGPNFWSIVRYSGFSNHSPDNYVLAPNFNDHGGDIVAIRENSISPQKLGDYLFGRGGFPKIDIVIFGYNYLDYYFPDNATGYARVDSLIKFMQQGGILLMFNENVSDNQVFLRRLFNKNDITTSGGAGAGSRYKIGFDGVDESMRQFYAPNNDPIMDGPFGNIVGSIVGEDASTTNYADHLPMDKVVLYASPNEIGQTNNRSTTGATIFRHQTLPFMWSGDGGFCSSNPTQTNENICPFKLTTRGINGHTYNHFPTYRQNFGGNNNYVQNAVFAANALAWAIKQSELMRRGSK